MKKLILVFILSSQVSFGQFKVVVDETFNLKIQAAVELIRQNDATSFAIVSDYCDQILISCDTIPKSDDGIINIPLRTVGGPSLNIIASVIVRESYKLRLLDVAKQLNDKEREVLCHAYELNFNKKLPREYGTSMKDKLRKFIDNLKDDPYQSSIQDTK
jgi:hypothetical protein